MSDRFELLTLADRITSAVDLDKKTAFEYVDRFHHCSDKLSIGDRECISSTCKKVIEWLSKQDTSELERKDWFSIVRKLCTHNKDYINEDNVDTDLHADVSQDVHRFNVSLLVNSNVVLRLIEMCFSNGESYYEEGADKNTIDFKNWYGRICLLCSFLECGWERLRIDQANALRFSASSILRMIPAISLESEKIFIRSILRVINRIVHLVAGYDGDEEFTLSFLQLYRQIIAATGNGRDQEDVVTSLIMNMNALSGSQNSQETIDMLWEMLLKMCSKLMDGDREGSKEHKNISPHADFHKSLDIWLSNFIQATIQDSLEEKIYRREEICNWIISTLTVSSCKLQPTFTDFEKVVRMSLIVKSEHSHSLCSSLSRLYTKVMQDSLYTLDEQCSLVHLVFDLWNTVNEPSSLIILKKIFEGDSTHSIFTRSASLILEEDESSERRVYLVLEECIGHMENEVKKELATKIVDKINDMDMTKKNEKSEGILKDRLRQLNIVLGRSTEDGGIGGRDGSIDHSYFNELLNSKEYTRMLNVSLEAYFGSDNKKVESEGEGEGASRRESIFVPPVNVDYLRRIVNGEKLLSYHQIHYFMIHSSLSKRREYVDYLININGGPHIELLITELCSYTIMDRMVESMLRMMINAREMFPNQLSSRYNTVLEYIARSLEDGTLSSLSPSTLKVLTTAITSVELRYVLCELSVNGGDRDAARPRMLKFIQIVKCSLITLEERSKLMEGVKSDVQKAISSIVMAYDEVSIPPTNKTLLIQQNMIIILRLHIGMKGIHSSTTSYMDLYLMELRLSKSTHSLECLLSLLLSALCEYPTAQHSTESGTDSFGASPLSPYITSPLMDRFTRLLLSLFSPSESTFLPYIEWSSVSKKPIGYWLDSVGDTSGRVASTLPLIVFLSNIIQGEGMREEIRSIVIGYIDENGPSLILRLMRSSPCKPVFFHALTPIILYLRSRTEISLEVDEMILDCVPLLFSDPITEMLDFFPVILQSTDRYAQTQLHWRSLRFPIVGDYGKEESSDPIFGSFKLLAQLSTFKRLVITMVETLAIRMEDWLMDVGDDIMVLSGVSATTNAHTVWKVQLISQAFGYISSVAEEARNREDDGENREEKEAYESDYDEEEEKLLLLEKRDVDEGNTCTFVNTCKEFTRQHWYNCYTCNMIESEGVCTVCALNCHRGHDISYSKLGSFFCDCGAKKCDALKGVENKPPMKRMTRMKVEKKDDNWTPTINLPIDISKEEVKKLLKSTRDILGMYPKSVNNLILAIECAHEGKFNIRKRRSSAMKAMENMKVKYNECIMIGKIVDNEGLEQLGRTNESVERNTDKECSQIVRLRDGCTLFVHVNEDCLSLVYMGVCTVGAELGDTRVERESLPFAPNRINVKKDYIVITGVEEMAILRVSLDSGDIIQRDTIRIKDATKNNPIVKSRLLIEDEGDESILVAVATLQFVRIYNLLKDMENHEVELVLPMGNVVDLAFIKKKDEDYMWISVVASPNHLYYHQLGGPGPSILDETRSIYLTNTIPLPVQNTTVSSMFYSEISRLLCISFHSALYCVHIKDGDLMALNEESFHKLDVGEVESFVGWSESDGMLSAISYPSPSNKIIFIYPTLNEVLVQVSPLSHSAISISLAPSSSFDSVVGIVILSGYRRPAMLFTSNWVSQPDLWMEDRPMKLEKIGMIEEYEGDGGEEKNHDQLVTLFETSYEVIDMEYVCTELDDTYSSGDLTMRLSTPEKMPVTCINKEEVNIGMRVSRRHSEVKGLRLEVDGSNGPTSLSFNGKEIKLKRRMRSIYDIALPPNETINSERSLSIRFKCKNGTPATIISLRGFGDSREDLYSRCLTYPPLSLPYQYVLHTLSLLEQLLAYDVDLPTHIDWEDGTRREWIVESCLLVITPRSLRPIITAKSKQILRRYLRGDICKYYDLKDKAIIQSFSLMRELSHQLPPPVIQSYSTAFTQMIDKRYDNIENYATKFFGDVSNMLSLMRREMIWMGIEDASTLNLISIYIHLVCSLLSNNHSMSNEVMKQLMEIVTDYKFTRVWRRMKDELRNRVRDSLNGLGLKNGEWIEKLIGAMNDKILNDMRMPIPVWWKEDGRKEEEKIDVHFQRCLNEMNVLVAVVASLIRELDTNKIMNIVKDIIDRLDTQSIMREEDEVGMKNVRMGGGIALIRKICKGKEKMKDEKRDMNEGNEEDGDNGEQLEQQRGGEVHEILNEIISPLLEDNERREKLLFVNFQLMEESLKFVSSLKEGQKMESVWNDVGGLSKLGTFDCLVEYYIRIGKWTLHFPLLFLLSKPSMEILSEDRKRIICEYSMVDKRISLWNQAEKLLYNASNCDKKKYSDTKNEYLITRNLDILRFEYLSKFNYTHEDSTAMIEIINVVKEIAEDTSDCWRRVCEGNVGWILVLTCKVIEPVGVAMLELIQLALRVTKEDDMKEPRCSQPPPSLLLSSFSISDTIFECSQSKNLLKVLMMKYLIGGEESRRWLMHSVCRSLMQLARRKNQIELANLLFYDILPLARTLGERGAQLCDLCSAYLPTLLPSSTLHSMAQSELINLEAMISKLENSDEKDAADWLVKGGMNWRDALYLSPDPCSHCIRPNEIMETLKISSIKSDARYTCNSHMYKLNGHYEISKVLIKLADMKKTRMFHRVNVYYTWNAIESAVELKSNRDMWKHVASAKVSSSDTEVTLAVSIPIVTNGLVIEFCEVNDLRGKSELHCPRCSSLVRPNPGICDNCGESVWQCIKCRSIQYDEKEPFLCSSCGYCKYARLDISVLGRHQPTMVITADNDKPMASRASKSMNKLQWEMDTNRSQLRINSVLAQSLLIRHPVIPIVSYQEDARVTMDPTYPHLAQIGPNDSRYISLHECIRKIRSASDSLVSQSLQLMSIREAMRRMEQMHSPPAHSTIQHGYYNGSDGGCIGCLTSSIIHSMSLLRSLSIHSNIYSTLISNSELIYNRMTKVCGSIDVMRDELESLLIRLCDGEEGVDRLCGLVIEGRISPSVLARSLLTVKNIGWNKRMDTLLECGMKREDGDESQIAFIHVLIHSLREGKNVMKMIEERKNMKRFMDERGPSCSEEKEGEEGGGETAWNIMDAIINSEEEICVNDIEKERMKSREVDRFLWRLIFSPSIFIRSLISRLIGGMMTIPGQIGTVISICLHGLSHSRLIEDAERCDQFFLAFNCLIERGQIKLRLFQSNFHIHLMGIILSESTRLSEWERGEYSVSHSSGGFVYHCTNLLTNLLSGSWLESLLLCSSRRCVMVPLLRSSILLRRVTIKRNRPIQRSLHQLENLLRRCTREDGLSLLTAAVACLSEVKDEKSRADVVGVILETLDPRENESDEFLIQIEKDAAQEDFLQGRMQQNPYKSGDASMGPLMRDIKNKICRESELIAFLEDDNGMELLVNGKIISLSLSVRSVYDGVWKGLHSGEPMVIVYRMRGLMGDAVEPFVENIDEKDEGESVGEEEGRLLLAFLDCKGVESTLNLLSNCSLSPNGCVLLVQLRKLLGHLLRVDKMKKELINTGGISVLLNVIKRVRREGLSTDQSMISAEIDLLKMINTLVSDPKHHSILIGISGEECEWLLALLDEEEEEGGSDKRDRPHSQLVIEVTKILGNAVLGSNEAEGILVTRLKDELNWEDILNENIESMDDRMRIGRRRRLNWMDDVSRKADSFTLILDAILDTPKGIALKEKLINAGVIENAVTALLYMHPPLYGTVESPEWKTYLSRPSLKLILRLLRGMAKGDERSQMEIAKKALPMLHRLEQVSSAEHVGTLAENVMEALSQNEEVSSQIDKVRDETKQKKRLMAMAMREKQLSKLGMQMGRRGEVKVSSRCIVNEPEVGETCDPLTSCCICRESILNGTRVPATYAYALPYRSQENVPTHCSLSLCVMVHVDCHYNAIRRSNGGRNADEWTKASLHNSGARCNMVVPIPVASPSSSDWNAAVLRMESDVEGVVPGGGPITRYRIFLDMCNLIRKFVLNRSFSENAGGGGRESNIQYLGVLHLLALHLPEGELSCTMASERLNSFLLTELSVCHWNEERLDVLRAFLRDIEIGEARGVARDSLLRESLLQWTFIDLYLNRVIPMDGEDRFKWLQSHFGETLKKTGELVKYFDTTLLPVKKNEELAQIIGVDLNDALSLSTVTTPT